MPMFKNVSKDFGSIKAVQNISFQVRAGSIFGLLGSNGSGKSTLLRLLAGIYAPDAGEITFKDQNVATAAVRRNMFYLSDDLYNFHNASMQDMAHFYRHIYKNFSMAAFEAMAENFQLDIKAPLRTFSKGMQRQGHLILALASQPDLLICDETFDGLDPVLRHAVKGLFADIAAKGSTVIIAGHNLRELEDICDHIALLHKGTLLFEESIWHLEESMVKIQAAFTEIMRQEDFEALGLHVVHFRRTGRMVHLTLREDKEKALESIGSLQPLYIESLPLSLEEIFITEMEVRGYDPRSIIKESV